MALFVCTAPDDASITVREQLEALTTNHISRAYYEYTSREFQKTTTLPQFREFLSIYPVLYNNHAYRLESSDVENHHAQVKGVLVSQELEEMEAEWGLVKEDGEWKVLSLRLVEIPTEDEQSRAITQMINFAKKQLEAMRKGDLVEAYYGFVSKDLQKETSIFDFESFMSDNPILTHYRAIDSEEGRVENDKGHVELSLENEEGNYLLEYVLSRELGEWKVFSLKVIMPQEVAIQKAATNPEALIPPVKDLLETLSSGQYYLAYQQTSKEFQDATSFEGFQKFIQSFPAFFDRELADIKGGEIENGTGNVRVNLHDEEGITVVDFRMGFSEGEWLIWGMEVMDSPEKKKKSLNSIAKEKVLPLADQLIAILRQQMAYLYRQDIYEAYALMMSKAYRAKHTLDAFEEFLDARPFFLNHQDSYFNRLLEEGGEAVLRGFLTTFEGESLPVQFDFTQEDGEWKINGMAVLEKHEPIAEAEQVLDAPTEDLPPRPLKFTKVELGTELDHGGLVIDPLKVVDLDEEFLFFNVDLENGQPGIEVTMLLEHVDSGSSASPISITLEEDGELILYFSYEAPDGRWPLGDYILKVKASTGQEYFFNFTVKQRAGMQAKMAAG